MNASTGLRSYIIGDRAFYKRVLSIVIPVIIQNGVTSFVSLLDNIMVGQLGTAQMSGVAVANQLLFIYNMCVFGGIAGASIFGAQFFGAGDYESMRASMRYKLYIALTMFLISLTVFRLFDTPLISLFLNDSDNPELVAETLACSKTYLSYMLIGLLPFALASSYSATLREAGETVLPMAAGVTAVFVNMVLNYILIFGHIGFPPLGVTGAAIATVTSRYVELAIVAICAHRNKKRYFYLTGVYRTLKVPLRLVKRIAVMGMPLLANEVLWSFGMSFLTQLYSMRGLSVVAAMNISNTISMLFNSAVFAMGSAAATMVGQALGSDDVDGAKKTAWRLMAFSAVIAVALGALLAAFSPLVPRIYNTSDEVRSLATRFILVLAGCTILNSFANCTYFTLRAGGKTIITFIFDCLSVWVLQVPVVFVLIHYTDCWIVYVYLCGEGIAVIKCIFGAYLVKKGVWINNITQG